MAKPSVPSLTPFQIERLLRDARRRDPDADHASEAEFRASLGDDAAPVDPDARLAALADDPQEQAQELAFQAFEASDADAALRLADEALVLDEHCLDALTIRAFLGCDDAAELIDALEAIVATGEDALGEQWFAEYRGDFWSMIPARPYLRSIKQLAELDWNVGRRFDAVDHYEYLLELDPDDHLGNSALLLGLYLAMGEVQRSWDLLEVYDDEQSAVYHWAWVLLFVMIDDPDAAREALDHALTANPFAATFFLGYGEMPVSTPPYVAAGSEDEAAVCAQILADAWRRNFEAQLWLHDILVDLGLLDPDDDDTAHGDPH